MSTVSPCCEFIESYLPKSRPKEPEAQPLRLRAISRGIRQNILIQVKTKTIGPARLHAEPTSGSDLGIWNGGNSINKWVGDLGPHRGGYPAVSVSSGMDPH